MQSVISPRRFISRSSRASTVSGILGLTFSTHADLRAFTAEGAHGLNRVAEILESGEKFAYPVYDAASVAEDTEKGDVQIFHFPAESKQYVILAAGGGYGRREFRRFGLRFA